MKKKLSFLLALLMIAVTGAWADTVVLGTPDASVTTLSDANGIVTITDASGSTGIQAGSGSYKMTYDGTAYVPMKLSGNRNFTLSYKEGVTISKVTLLAMSNGDAEGTVGAGDGDATSLGTFPARNSNGTCLTVDITGKTGLRGSRQFLALIVVEYSTTAPSLNATPAELTFALNPNQTSKTQSFTLSGQNLTNGTYNLTVPTVEGLTVSPTSFTVAEGKVNQEVSVTYASTSDIAKAEAQISATVDEIPATVDITYQSRTTAYTQSTVSAEATWDWTKLTETAELTDDTTPSKSDEFLLADLDDRITFNEAFGDPTAIIMKYMQFPSRGGYAQGETIKFKTSVPGTISVVFSNTGKDRPYRYIFVNGEPTEFKSNTADWVTAEGINVPAGEVTLTAWLPTDGDASTDIKDGAGSMLRWQKITFTPGEEPAAFQDFEAIINNQTGTLLTTEEQVQNTAVNFGIAVDAEGKTTRVDTNDASAIATISGTYHSEHGLTGMKLVTAVPGAVKILVGKCTYAGSKITVTNSDGLTVAEYTPKGEQGSGDRVCWKNDHNNLMELIYTGEATTLTITGMQYCPFIAVKKYVAPAEFQDFEAIINNQTGTLLTAEEQVQNTAVNFGIAVNAEGKTTRVDTNDASAIATISGTYHSEHGLTGMKLVTAVPGAVKILVGKCTYAGSKITVTNSDGLTVAEYTPKGEQGSGDRVCWKNDHNNLMELIYTGEATTLTITGMQYCPFIAVKKIIETEPVTLENEPATVTFPFNLGTEGQKATFSEGDANYFLNSKVAWGSNFTVNGTRTVSGITETQLMATAKVTAAEESNLIKFTFTPKPGFIFTPTKVTFTATRVGTDDGALDIAWLNSDKTTATLANLKKADSNLPARDNNTPNFTTFTYDLTTVNGIIAGEGECGLQFYLYSINAGKNYGFANILIEGTLSGTEQELPILASFKVNETEYAVEDVFGDGYEATLELSKTETIVSESNPLTEITATSGEVGNVVYADATDSSCKVTIPVTAGNTTLDYVLNVVYKPDFTLQYISVDGTTVLEEQTVEKDAKIGEFAYNIADVQAKTDGYKARGWFKNNYVGEKWTTESTITADAKLYAVETEIEVSSDSKKYVFDLTDKNFDAADHEAFNPTGNGKWHDNQHGWAFANGDKIDLLVGGKASIILGLCQYSADVKITASNGESVDAKVATDGATATIEYEGEPGTLTLNFNGTTYLHKLTIFNTTTTNYEVNGDWIIVKEGDASSLADAIESAKEGTKIFLPNGTYDLGQKTLTTIGNNNVSIIGESMEGVIIKNRPTAEGISTTATLLNTSTGLYMQDLTLQNDWDYYNGGADGRAVCIQDKGTQTICKNVTLLSYQDTYYTNNPNGEYYWETSDIHGTVDFICGEGTLFMEESTLTVEKRKADGSGECTITAPSTAAGKEVGYVFNNCKIENSAASFNLGRAWNNEPRCAFINPTYNDNKLIANRWTLKGMNVVAKEFVEYNPSDGKTENNVTFTYGTASNTMNTIISDADKFSIDKVFSGWAPNEIATQVEAPTATLEDGTIKWDAVSGATAYAIFKDGELLTIVGSEATSYTIEESTSGAPSLEGDTATPVYTLRAANERGGFGEPKEVTVADGINRLNIDQNGDVKLYDLQGRRIMTPTTGVYIVNGKKVVIK